MRQHESRDLMRAGLFVAVLLVFAMAIIIFLGKESSIFDSMLSIHSKTEDVKNLRTGAKVKLKGVKIGHVSAIEFENFREIIVTMKISSRFQDILKIDSVVSIKTQGMLGDKYVEIYGGSEQSKSIEDGTILEIKDEFDIKGIVDKGDNLLKVSSDVLNKVNFLLDQLNKKDRIGGTIDKVSSSTAKLDVLLAKIDPNKVENIVTNLDKMATQANTGPGTIYSLLYDQSAYEELRLLLGGAQRNKVLKYFIRESIKNAQEVND